MDALVDWGRWSTMGVAPFGGGLMENPHYVMETFDIIEAVKMELQNRERKDSEARG